MLRLIEARNLLTPATRAVLAKVATKKDAFTPEALAEAGVPAPLITAMLVAPDHAPMEKARVSLHGRARIETRNYIWGPDVAGMLRGWQ